MKIYTVIPYYTNGVEVFSNDVKSFTTFKAAERYANALPYGKYDIVENEFYLNETCECEAFKCDCKN
jgi:hypothetical protein